MQSAATNVDDYLASLPPDRRSAIASVRNAINAKLPTGYQEGIHYGMITWCVPESVLAAREVYNKKPLCFAGLASQKNYMALHLLAVYFDPKERAWFETAYKKSGKKLDMGQGCVRFKTIDALPVDVVAEAMARIPVDKFVATYRSNREERSKTGASKGAAKKSPSKKAPGKKPAPKKPAPKKPAAKKR
jgi:uncharacterized protein YdhG (YjbR/CyaY superfamily)